MGVHGLTSLLVQHGLLPSAPKRHGVGGNLPSFSSSTAAAADDDDDDDVPTTLDVPTRHDAHYQTIPRGSTLAIDGDGLSFHLLRMAYRQYRRNVLDAAASSSGAASVASLIPTFLPPYVVHTTTVSYLTELIVNRGMRHATIYWDAPSAGTNANASIGQRMKRRERRRRDQRREEEWTNLREYCERGVLPRGCSGGGGKRRISRYRSSSRKSSSRQQQQPNQHAVGTNDAHANEEEAEAEAYWSSFPLGRLVLEQCRRSMEHFATTVPGRVSFVDCLGEADVEVAKASASDATGRTYCLGQDSDYCIYGHDPSDSGGSVCSKKETIRYGEDQYFAGSSFQARAPDASALPLPSFGAEDTADSGALPNVESNANGGISREEAEVHPGAQIGSVQYVPLQQLDFSLPHELRGTIVRPADVATSIGLPDARYLVDLSIVLGNDYTGPFLRHADSSKRMQYRQSLYWERDAIEDNDVDATANDAATWGKLAELDWSDIGSIVEFVVDKAEHGFRVRSEIPRLDAAISFSGALYSFEDVKQLDLDDVLDNDSDEEEGSADAAMGNVDMQAALVATKCTPSLSSTLDISLAISAKDRMPLRDAILVPFMQHMANSYQRQEGDACVEQLHADAFRVVTEVLSSNHHSETRAPNKIRWNDVRVLYMLERIVIATVRDEAGDDGGAALLFEVLDPSSYLYAVESLSYEDFSLDNEIQGKNEREFIEEATSHHPKAAKAETKKAQPKQQLPIDEHEHEILEAVRTQRVTIIHGKTGCGKSSRVPIMLLRSQPPEPTTKAPEVKMFITQPRRIAAKSLTERVRDCEPDLKKTIALRMGHGMREYEGMETRAWFVTTGYCVRLLANHPEFFDSHTHLVIDEVHERSVDCDIICLLCRRLLASHPTIRLVLMSATMAASLYQSYFGSPECPIAPPIHVGARRFPIKEFFVEDLAKALKLPQKDAKRAMEVFDECEARKCRSAPSRSHMDKLFHLAKQITLSVGTTNGSAVLIFVTGMNDIEALCDLIESINKPGVIFTCLPIHSDVPFEEQMAAFEPAGEGEVKVVIATNAAESSVTLPDVDHVICLGLCKQIVYNEASHRQMLQPTWISKASATQRAGRTGRVREGNVYRLYSRNAYHKYMAPFEAGEMVRIPLDSVILSLRDMLKEEVTPVLLSCLEPPDISNIDRSFKSLHKANFIDAPSDGCEITSLGALVVALGIDLTLGALVGLGIQFGVGAEAIEMAAILSFPKTPWAMTNPMYHDADQFNDITSRTFVSRCQFDAGLYSEPMGIMNLLHSFRMAKYKGEFCRKQCVAFTRLRHLHGTVESLRRRVADRLNVPMDFLEVEQPPFEAPHAKVTILRILQTWLFHDTMIELSKKKELQASDAGTFSIELNGPPIEPKHLLQILDEERHPFEIINRVKIIHSGSFVAGDAYQADTDDYFRSFECRIVSYALEHQHDIVTYYSGASIHIFVAAAVWNESEGLQRFIASCGIFKEAPVAVDYVEVHSKNKRGRRGRACAAFTQYPSGGDPLPGGVAISLVRLSSRQKKTKAKDFKKIFDKHILDADPELLRSFISCTTADMAWGRRQMNRKVQFTLTTGGDCSEVSGIDLCDLFSSTAEDLSYTATKQQAPQTVKFYTSDSEVADLGPCPLLDDVPEAAKLMMVMASERRRDNFIRFDNGEDNVPIDVSLARDLGINSGRWRRHQSNGMVYVPVNCVPSTAVPTGDTVSELFAVCANTLELNGGAIRAEGMSLLPPGRLFYALALLSFGIHPISQSSLSLGLLEGDEGGDLDELCAQLVPWICETSPEFTQETMGDWIIERIEKAVSFNRSCMSLGEELVCHENAVRGLCDIFDEVDGYAVDVWDDLGANPFVPTNQSRERLLHPASTVSSRANSRASSRANRRQSRREYMSEDDATAAKPKSSTRVVQSSMEVLASTATENTTANTQWDNALTSLYAEMNSALPITDGGLLQTAPNERDEVPSAEGSTKTKRKNRKRRRGRGKKESDTQTSTVVLESANAAPNGRSEEAPEDFNCDKCGETFPSWKKKKKHLRQCCPGDLNRRYQCISCSEHFVKHNDCLDHMRSCCPSMLTESILTNPDHCLVIVSDETSRTTSDATQSDGADVVKEIKLKAFEFGGFKAGDRVENAGATTHKQAFCVGFTGTSTKPQAKLVLDNGSNGSVPLDRVRVVQSASSDDFVYSGDPDDKSFWLAPFSSASNDLPAIAKEIQQRATTVRIRKRERKEGDEQQEYDDYISSGVYECLLCGEINRWHKCRLHMQRCCPEDLICRSIDEIKELSEVVDNEIKASFAEAEHQRLRGAPADGKDPVYKCLFCPEEVAKWKQCKAHMKREHGDYMAEDPTPITPYDCLVQHSLG